MAPRKVRVCTKFDTLGSGHEFTHAVNRPTFSENIVRGEAAFKPRQNLIAPPKHCHPERSSPWRTRSKDPAVAFRLVSGLGFTVPRRQVSAAGAASVMP